MVVWALLPFSPAISITPSVQGSSPPGHWHSNLNFSPKKCVGVFVLLVCVNGFNETPSSPGPQWLHRVTEIVCLNHMQLEIFSLLCRIIPDLWKCDGDTQVSCTNSQKPYRCMKTVQFMNYRDTDFAPHPHLHPQQAGSCELLVLFGFKKLGFIFNVIGLFSFVCCSHFKQNRSMIDYLFSSCCLLKTQGVDLYRFLDLHGVRCTISQQNGLITWETHTVSLVSHLRH